MGLLAVTVTTMIAVAGCYSPALLDCTVSCSQASDCASGQVCGADGMCAAPDVAGHCDHQEPIDAAVTIDAPDDAPDQTTVKIHVRIMGKGTVTVNATLCDDKGPMASDCMISVAQGRPATIRAIDDTDHFQMWTSLACGGQPATCAITPVLPTTDVSAKFTKMD